VSSQVPGSAKSAKRAAAQQRTAAARARLAAAQRRRRLLTVAASVVAVLAVVATLIIVKVAIGGGGPKSGQQAHTATSPVAAAVTSVPGRALDTVGVGTASTPPKAITSAPALTSAGKPEIFYAGAEYCPYCATERWALAVALSRFGTFHNLGQTASSPSDVYPNTPTLTFHGASYSSPYISFVAKEMQSNQVVNGHYAPLDSLSSSQQALLAKYDAPPYSSPAGSIPFIDIGGKYVVSGASYNPQVLQGKTHAQVAAALSDPNSAIAKGADGTANLITAAICAATHNQPAKVCASAGVTAAAKVLNRG
jgi:uncharacterized membrane protein